MDILIVSDFCGYFDGSSNSRFQYIAKNLTFLGHEIEILTSNFSHGSKSYLRNIKTNNNYKITMLFEPSYKTNVCLRRFYSHFVWGINVMRYLRKRKKPDIIYCAMPTLTAAYATAKYCEKNNIKFIVDVQDLWPEAYRMVFNVPILSDIVYTPFNFLANNAYKRADEIIAVSKTYVERAISVNKKVKKGHSIFLGTNLSDFDVNVKNNPVDKMTNIPIKDEKELWLAYCGSLGASYDLTCVFDALEIVRNNGIKPPKFIIMGDGPRRKEFEQYVKDKNINVFFTGRLPYPQMCSVLCKCDITVNPIKHGAAGSIINKHADYAASGLPVLNTQECLEYRKLVDEYKMGINCRNSDSKDLADKLEILIKDKNLRKKMGQNARCCAEEKFDRANSYKEIYAILENNFI